VEVLLPHEAPREKLAREDNDGENDDDELQEPQAADLALERRIRFFGAHLLAASQLQLTLLLALQPVVVQLLALLAVLGIANATEPGNRTRRKDRERGTARPFKTSACAHRLAG
jgi:hypothetical protein